MLLNEQSTHKTPHINALPPGLQALGEIGRLLLSGSVRVPPPQGATRGAPANCRAAVRGLGEYDVLLGFSWTAYAYDVVIGAPWRIISQPLLEQPRASHSSHRAALKAARRTTNDVRCIENRGPGKRNRVRNRFRAGTLRRWLLDGVGEDLLRRGTGVLDVAAGKGELAFEFVNLNGIPATALEPRVLQLQRHVKWLEVG